MFEHFFGADNFWPKHPVKESTVWSASSNRVVCPSAMAIDSNRLKKVRRIAGFILGAWNDWNELKFEMIDSDYKIVC